MSSSAASMPLDPRFLATAIDIVLRAGEIQLATLARGLTIGLKGEIDLVTDADLAAERMCRDVLASRFPSHAILAEELGGSVPAPPASGCCWIFDPIDGTTNYAHGLPIFCASLALEIDGRVEVAAIYDPTRKELFTAERGGGAYLNGAPLRVSRAARLIDALLVTGFPYDIHAHADEVLGLFGAFIHRARAVRRLGSAALDMAYVAAGRFDGFWEDGLKPWDVAAASLLVEEAGGALSGIDGSPFRARAGHVLAAAPAIHPLMLETIRSFRDERSRNRTP
ncbi:MAG TPA: inositol monophosphatase family protein [Vicinamibacterales bacterium]|nr:inositol monophosphatase family protein [Vicinamibacterales bacterium]